MQVYRFETTVKQDGFLTVDTLPLKKGEQVEIIILRKEPQKAQKNTFILFDTVKMNGNGLTAAEMVILDRD